jgi:hypothetical protein
VETAINLILDWFRNWSSVISGLGSLVLTFYLVYLYKLQHDIQTKQTELTENQQRPILRIEDYQLFSGADVEQVLNQEDLNPNSYQPRGFLLAIVSNFGKGPADGLRAELVFDTEDALLRITSVFDHGGHIDPIAFSEDGGVIGAEERDVFLNCQFMVLKEKIPDEWVVEEDARELLTPTEIMWSIQNGGNERVEVTMRVLYNNATGVTDYKTIFRSDVDLTKCGDFGLIQDRGEPIYPNID